MKEQSSSERFRSIKAFKEFEQRSLPPEEGTPADRGASVSSGQVSPLRVLSLLKQHGAGVRRSELERELQASPAAVETAVLRLVKEGLVTVQRGGGPDELLIAP